MARQPRTTTVPYFKLDAGQFIAETMGLSAAAVGLYIKAMCLYWEAGCVLPAHDVLKRQLCVRTQRDREALEDILGTFFEDGRHERLDACLAEVQKFSQQQRERAQSRHRKPEPKDESTDDDF
ncbi:DUF1376 domain-containing protein [uncultured Propionivibrio sp.]|uniref:DUF1376 domain-containing protein n=1 Tax=uncultured Propionivibrio sp. TaxID=426737 RepID=UPI0029C0FA6B|nr:DUF1376 domain-containing protein [uncultured Propionivibrio sp.]